jgi:hypothetical protein
VIALWLLAGGLLGIVNGLTQWWTVSRLRPRVRLAPLALVWGGLILRLALVAAVLTLGLRRGVIPGLLAFAGLWLARWGIAIYFGAWRPSEAQRPTAPSGD